MRTFKASKKKRMTYTYHTANGEKVILTPDDVGESWIALLHEEDDDMVDAYRRERYHAPIRYDAFSGADSEADNSNDKMACLSDTASDPLESLVKALDEQEHEITLKKLETAIQALQPKQKALIRQVFYEGRTRASIAAEEGVSEAAIRDRLKKIYAQLKKKLMA